MIFNFHEVTDLCLSNSKLETARLIDLHIVSYDFFCVLDDRPAPAVNIFWP